MTPYRIRCSCGRETTITWVGTHYQAATPGWTAAAPAGWTCGRPGHTQRVPPEQALAMPTPAPITL